MNSTKTNINNVKTWTRSHKVLCVLLSIALALLLVPTASIYTAKAFAEDANTTDTTDQDSTIVPDSDKGGEEGQEEKSADDKGDSATPESKDSESQDQQTSDADADKASSDTADNADIVVPAQEQTQEDTESAKDAVSNDAYTFKGEYDEGAKIYYSDRVENDTFTISGKEVTVRVDPRDTSQLSVYATEEGGEEREYMILNTYWEDAETEKAFAYWTLDDENLHPGKRTTVFNPSETHVLKAHYVQECVISGTINVGEGITIKDTLNVTFNYGPITQSKGEVWKDADANWQYSINVKSGRSGDLVIFDSDKTWDHTKWVTISTSELKDATLQKDINISADEKTIDLYSFHPGKVQFEDKTTGDTYSSYTHSFNSDPYTVILKRLTTGVTAYQVIFPDPVDATKSKIFTTTNFQDGYQFKCFTYLNDDGETTTEVTDADFEAKGNSIEVQFNGDNFIGLDVVNSDTNVINVTGTVDASGTSEAIPGAFVTIYDEDWDVVAHARTELDGTFDCTYSIPEGSLEETLHYEINHKNYDTYLAGNTFTRTSLDEPIVADLGTLYLTQNETCVVNAIANTDGGYLKDDTGDYYLIGSDMLDLSKGVQYYIDSKTNELQIGYKGSGGAGEIVLNANPVPYEANEFIGWYMYNGTSEDTIVYDKWTDLTGDTNFYANFEEIVLAEGIITDQNGSPVAGANVAFVYGATTQEEAFSAITDGPHPAFDMLETTTDASGYYKFDKPESFEKDWGLIVAYLPGYIPQTRQVDHIPVTYYVDLTMTKVDGTIPLVGFVDTVDDAGNWKHAANADVTYTSFISTEAQTTKTNVDGQFSLIGFATTEGTVIAKYGDQVGRAYVDEEYYDDKLGCLITHINVGEKPCMFHTNGNGMFYYAEGVSDPSKGYPLDDGFVNYYYDSFAPGTTIKCSSGDSGKASIITLTENASGTETKYELTVSCEPQKPGSTFQYWTMTTYDKEDKEIERIQLTEDTVIDPISEDIAYYDFAAEFTIDSGVVCGMVYDVSYQPVNEANVYFIDASNFVNSSLEQDGQALAQSAIASGALGSDDMPSAQTDEDGWYCIKGVDNKGIVLGGKAGYFPDASLVKAAGTQIHPLTLISTQGQMPVYGNVMQYNNVTKLWEGSPNASVTYINMDDRSVVQAQANSDGEYRLLGGSTYNCYVAAESEVLPKQYGSTIGTEANYWKELGVELVGVRLDLNAVAFATHDENAGLVSVTDEYTVEGQAQTDEEVTSLWWDLYSYDTEVTLGNDGLVVLGDTYLDQPSTTSVVPQAKSGYKFDSWTLCDLKTGEETPLTEAFEVDGAKMLIANFVSATTPASDVPSSQDAASNGQSATSGKTSSSSTSDNLAWIIACFAGVALLGAGAVYFARRKQNH